MTNTPAIPDWTPTSTPEQDQAARSDAELLAYAAGLATTHPDIPAPLRDPLAEVLRGAARDTVEGGGDYRAVRLAQALTAASPAPGRTVAERVATAAGTLRQALAIREAATRAVDEADAWRHNTNLDNQRLREHVERLETELDGVRDQAAAPGWRISNTLGLINELVRGCEVDEVVADRLRESLTTSPKPRDLPSPHAGASPMNGPLRPVSPEALTRSVNDSNSKEI